MGYGEPEGDKCGKPEKMKRKNRANNGDEGRLLTVHRLDRQTSGIVFFAKNETASNRFRELMEANMIKKVYYARVYGDFSKCEGLDNNKVTVQNYIYCISFIEGLWECKNMNQVPFEQKTKAKEAKTLFKFKFYDPVSNTSVVKCYPETGRTHQIRVHLKYLGFPIANDLMYFSQDFVKEKEELGNETDNQKWPIMNDGTDRYDLKYFASGAAANQ